MALDAIRESVDGLSDDVKKEYTAKDGKFFLDVKSVDGYSLENVTELKTALQTSKGLMNDAIISRDKSKAKLTLFGDVDPSKITNMQEQLKKFKDFDPEKEADKIAQERASVLFGDKERSLVAKHVEEKAQLVQERDALDVALSSSLIDAQASLAIGKHKGREFFLAPHIQAQTKVIKNDAGIHEVVVIDPKTGATRISNRPSDNGNMSVEELVGSWKEEESFQPAFDAEGYSGGGGGGPKIAPSGKKPLVISAEQARDGSYADQINKGEVIVG